MGLAREFQGGVLPSLKGVGNYGVIGGRVGSSSSDLGAVLREVTNCPGLERSPDPLVRMLCPKSVLAYS